PRSARVPRVVHRCEPVRVAGPRASLSSGLPRRWSQRVASPPRRPDNGCMHALTFSRFGGPEVLEWTALPDPQPAPGVAVVRTRAIGKGGPLEDLGAAEAG